MFMIQKYKTPNKVKFIHIQHPLKVNKPAENQENPMHTMEQDQLKMFNKFQYWN